MTGPGSIRPAENIEAKYQRLREILSDMDGAVVAFSGGVDSTVLLAVAAEVLGGRVMAVTSVSPILPAADRALAEEIAASLGVEHRLIETGEMSNPSFVANGPKRCFYCKMGLFEALWRLARQAGYETVLEGSNLDDEGDYRPGRQAVLAQAVRSPLLEAAFTKEDVRRLAKHLDLPNADKPSAACLASRIPYGERITEERLFRIERAERFLTSLDLAHVRVRDHGTIARIEVPRNSIPKLCDPATMRNVVQALQNLGWTFVTLDMTGYEVGSLNKMLGHDEGSS